MIEGGKTRICLRETVELGVKMQFFFFAFIYSTGCVLVFLVILTALNPWGGYLICLFFFFVFFFFFVKRMSHLLFSRCIYALTPADRVVLRSSLMIITVPSLFPVFVCRKLYILGERRITCKAITFLMHFAFCSLTQAYSMCVYVM